MLRRVATPPPRDDDEPVYLTLVHPYPLNANLELHADRRALALWLACCTRNKDVLLAMFHNPTSPGIVIIEVDRIFDRFQDLLGMHSWSTFLLNPTHWQESGMASKVFYCTYNSGRLVEKNGWKRVWIEEHWFQGWSPNNSRIRYPYPRTAYCHVPPGAQPVCRPLPPRAFPVPPPPLIPVSAPPLIPVSAPPPTSIGLPMLCLILGVCLLVEWFATRNN
ncbi:hypothetical protein BJV78DRAFT_149681 [Lactifluus subvellereus]|nr:hypothetical protein BJV78DRAFT_149681 [Lactifluus subvellereus]